MKILHTGDWHGDKSTAGVPRFDDVARAVQQTVDVAIREKVDLYCMTGDLADPDAGPVVIRCVDLALQAAVQLAAAGIQSLWIPGNHDVVEDGTGTTTLSPLRNFHKLVQLVDEPCVMEYPEFGISTVLLPYPPTGRAYDPAQFVHDNRVIIGHDRVLVAGHLTELSGIPDGEETLEMPRGRGVPFPIEQCEPSWLLCNGHWHARQTYRSGGRDVHICGSLARLTFGEEKNQPSFNVYTL